MEKLIRLEDRRITDLATRIDHRIPAEAEYFAVPISEVDNPERWRKAARLVGRQRGWKVRTGITKRCVWMADERTLVDDEPTATDVEITSQLERLIEISLNEKN